MRPHSDAMLIAREPELPGLVAALTPSVLRAQLAPLWHGPVPTLHGVYARYKPGTSCMVAYAADDAADADAAIHHATWPLYVLAHRFDAVDKMANARRLGAHAALGATLVVDDLSLVAYRFPVDRRLEQLALLATPTGCRTLLTRLGLTPVDDSLPVTCRVLRYKPERRCVVDLTVGAQRVLVKLYADDESFNAAYAGARFPAAPGLSLADLAGKSRRYRALAWRWVDGVPLDGVPLDGVPLDGVPPAAGSTADLYAEAGRALALLHNQPFRGDNRYDAATERLALLRAGQAVVSLDPDLRMVVEHLLGDLLPDLVDPPYRATPVHGDFTPDQVMVDTRSGAVTLLDFDRAGRGDPAADLGAWRAWLLHHALQAGGCARDADCAMDAFLRGYARARPLPPADFIRLHTAMRLLRLAPETFRKRRQADWSTAMVRCLQAVQEVIHGG